MALSIIDQFQLIVHVSKFLGSWNVKNL